MALARVLAILVDALRYDQVNPYDTPFIHEIAEHGSKSRLKPILGYSDAIRATIFTGAYPDKHGYWMSYCYSPKSSPFRAMRWLTFLDQIPSDFIRRGFKFVLSCTVVNLVGKLRGYPNLHLHNMPFRILDRFDMTLRRSMIEPHPFPGYPTIFDELRARGVKFAYLDSSKLRGRLLRQVQELDNDLGFAFVYLHYIDESAHWSGINSPRFKESLRRVDAIVRSIVLILKRKFGESLDVVLFSDHGMAEETRTINLDWLTRMDGFGKDFVLCLDATMVRIWYERPGLRSGLRRLILRTGNCRLLSENDRKQLGIAFGDRTYGDDIFLFDEGQIIFPNFHSYIRPKAMHAYNPEGRTQYGVFILSGYPDSKQIKAETVELVDIGPTLLALLGLSVPRTFEGQPLQSNYWAKSSYQQPSD